MKVTLQFHGGRYEIFSMVRAWGQETGMILVEERFAPTYQVRLVDGDNWTGSSEGWSRNVDRISLNPSPVDLSASSSLEYAKKNQGALFVTLGEQTGEFLKESFLAGMTDSAPVAAIWKRLRERAKKSMQKGAWVENTFSGARSRAENHYYTPEAKRLADSGVILMGGTDWLRYDLSQMELP